MEGIGTLPTDGEVEGMKIGKMIKTLQEPGINTNNIEEKEDAKMLLLQKLPEVREAIAAQRQPGKITETLQRAMSENKNRRRRLADICTSNLEFVASMDDDDKQEMNKFVGQDSEAVLRHVISFLQNDDCPILVIGETSSGKSSLLNLLLGEDVLPVSHRICTSTLCFIRYGRVKRATVYLRGNPTVCTIDLEGADRAKKEELASNLRRWGRQDAEEVEKVVIEWPLEFLQGGIYLVDAPGMKVKNMDEVVARFLSSNFAFILYMINSAIALVPAASSGQGGEGLMTDEHRDGLSILLELCKTEKWGNKLDMSLFDLESTMFVCNKWDCVQHSGEEEVKTGYIRSLKSHFPELRDDQVFFLSCIKAVGPADQLSPEFSRLLDGLDKLLPQSLHHKLELQYQHVYHVLQRASQYIRLKLHSAYGTQRERKKAKEGAQSRLENFKQRSKKVLKDLDKMLKATRKEAEDHLRAFLTDEALRQHVYQKILSDFPEVDDSEIGKARLITAIANEIETQLKSNPNSAFNQCIRDADIRLREEFQTQYGSLLEDHNKVIEALLETPRLPSKFQQLDKFFKTAFVRLASGISASYRLARSVDTSYPTLGNTTRRTVDLAKELIKIHPDNKKEYMYIRHFTNQVFDAMTEAEAIKKAVKEHLKRPIQYLEACKSAIPELRRVDEQLMQNETRPEDEVSRIYEPKMERITQQAESLCGFYTTDIKQHKYDVRDIGKPSSWRLHKEGAHGRVYLVQISEDKRTFTAAVKIPRVVPAGETYATFVREEENLRKLEGRHVVECYGTYQGDNYEGYPCLGLVMEFCPKTLDEEMFEKRENSPAWWKGNPEKQAAAFSYTQNLAVQLCEGLKHIHDAGYMHRDLKLVNILVSSEGVVKLADLGSSKAEEAYARTKEGTPLYMAPEVLEQKEYDKSADIYSLGLILLEMWYGRTIYFLEEPGYESQLEQALPLNIGKELPLPSWHGRVPPIPEWWKLINECLRRNPQNRPTADECRARIAAISLHPAQGDFEEQAAAGVRVVSLAHGSSVQGGTLGNRRPLCREETLQHGENSEIITTHHVYRSEADHKPPADDSLRVETNAETEKSSSATVCSTDLEHLLDTILSRLEETDVRLLMRVRSARSSKQEIQGVSADLMKDMMKNEYITAGNLRMLEKDMTAAGIGFPAIVRDIPGVPEELKYPRTTEAAVGPEGGELEIPGFVKIIVPPGVLQQDTVITMSTVDVGAILRDPGSINWLSGYPWSLGEDACPRELLDQVLFSPAVDINLHGAQLNGPVEVQTWRPPGSEGMGCLLLKHHDEEGWTDITASTRHHIDSDRLSMLLQNFSIITILWNLVDKVKAMLNAVLAAFSLRTMNCPLFMGYIKPMAHNVHFHVVCRDQSVETDEYLPGFTKCGSNSAMFSLFHGNVLDIIVNVRGGQSDSQRMELNSNQCCSQNGQSIQMLLDRPHGEYVMGKVDVKKVQVPTDRLACQFIFQEEGDISASMSRRDRAGTGASDVENSFDKVIEDVSSRWDDLARKLGFSRNKIRGIQLLEPDNDHRCRDMLHRWRNKKGSDATLQVLKQALIDIGERRTAESL